ncbi:MAG: DUF2892 domain-containing protein [Chloroflexi bacterium HGW-Chloroflexi-2]|jgi:hypothetical protein|nr:MAG: DUF2892 domain-containing protein [Chloroflexi bacterium HGW-Chloroflexi-2]
MKYVNEAGWDRIVRVILGVVLLILAFSNIVSGGLGTLFIIVGIVALLTGLSGICPAYMLLKFRTKKN